jgi:hypothetical protein
LEGFGMTTKIIDDVLNDPTISDWLKWALRSALHRDPLDAANDAELLFWALSTRLGEMFEQAADHAPPEYANNGCVSL